MFWPTYPFDDTAACVAATVVPPAPDDTGGVASGAGTLMPWRVRPQIERPKEQDRLQKPQVLKRHVTGRVTCNLMLEFEERINVEVNYTDPEVEELILLGVL